MEPFTVHTGIVAPIPRANIDTDAIIPKQFLNALSAQGSANFCFMTGDSPMKGCRSVTFYSIRHLTRMRQFLWQVPISDVAHHANTHHGHCSTLGFGS